MVVALGVAAAGCSGDDGDDAASDTSPLEEYFGEDSISYDGGGLTFSYDGGNTDSREPTEAELQQQRDFEDAVAECMAELGFEYIPNVVMPGEYDVGPWEEAYSLPEDEFAETYGYGASTMNFEEAEAEIAESDPNREIRDSLSPQAQQEYDKALYGQQSLEMAEGSSTDPPDSATQPPLADEDLGCYGVASEEIYGESITEFEDPFADFESMFDDIYQLGERLRNDPRVEDATEAWKACMADAGYPDFEQVGEPEQEVWRRWNELMGWSAAPPVEETGGGAGEGSATSTDVPQQPEPVDPAEREEFQNYELDLAQADRRCLDEHYTEVATEVRHELEEEFVAEHRDELKRYRDALAEFESSGGFGGGG